jgi:hypothetical protein
MSDDAYLPRYIKLRDFKSSGMPTQRAFELFFSKALQLFKKDKDEDEDAISSDRLHKTPDADLDILVPPPAFGPLLRVLDENLSDWLQNTAANNTIKLIVLPPCEENGIIQSWAESNGLTCLQPPTPQAILSGTATLPDLRGDSPLIIPRLEAWMMRTYYGLNVIRELLAVLAESERKIVIGCNIYAWEFLKTAVSAASFLPEPMTFDALSSDQLHDWFQALHSASAMQHIKLRHQHSANDVFSDDSEGRDNNYFKILAATSSGIPWVAWHLWRNNLLTQNDDSKVGETDDTGPAERTEDDTSATANNDDRQTLWVAELQAYALPGSEKKLALLVLQAILIHNEITTEHLVKVLPDIRPLTVVPLLKRAGIITHQQGVLRCKPAAYPAIREGLTSSGFPLGVF